MPTISFATVRMLSALLLALQGCGPASNADLKEGLFGRRQAARKQAAPAAKPKPRQAPSMQTLLPLIDQTVERYRTQKLQAPLNPWIAGHGILAYGRDLMVSRGSDQKAIPAIDWLLDCAMDERRHPAFMETRYGIRGTFGPFREGHAVQFLGLLSELGLQPDHPIRAWSPTEKRCKTYHVSDLINDAKMTAGINTIGKQPYEMTWILWGLSAYVDPNDSWRNARNEEWTLQRVLNYETQPITRKTSCGGSHRLYALHLAMERAAEKGQTYDSGKAKQTIAHHIRLAQSWQNADGSFAKGVFMYPGYAPELDKRIRYTGHVMEFLATAAPLDVLEAEWMRRAALSLVADLSQVPQITAKNWMVHGGMYHAINGLKRFAERIRSRQSD